MDSLPTARRARLNYNVQKSEDGCVETHSVQISPALGKSKRNLLSWIGVQLSRTPYGAFAVKIFQAVRIPLAVASAAGAALVQVRSAHAPPYLIAND